MADKIANSVVGTTPMGRLIYQSLTEKESYTIEGKPTEPKYSATLLFDEAAQKTPEYKHLTKGIADLIANTFGKRPLPQKFWNPIRDASEKVSKEGTPLPGFDVKNGKWMKFATAFDFEAYSPMNELVKDKEELAKGFYNGCYARVVYEAKLYESGGGGIGLYLVKIQKMKNGERLGGSSAAAGLGFDAVDIGDDDPMA